MTATRRDILAGLGAATLPLDWAARAAPAALPSPDPRLWAPPPNVPSREGYAIGPNGKIFYRRFGGGARLPLVVLHGGPAGAHGYMMPYARLALDRPVVLYDQSGCGRSSAPPELKRYTVARYVIELEELRQQLGFDRMLLLGHSWGGMLAAAYAAKYPDRVAGVVLAGTAPDMRGFTDAARHWLADLGPRAVATAKGPHDDPAYGALVARYYALHLCRLPKWPKFFEDAAEAIGRNAVYTYLNGPSEFEFTGALAGYNGIAAARAIRVPTLVTCGEFDEAPPFVGRRLTALIPGSRLEAFAGLSHMSHIEDPARVVGATRRFLAGVG